MKDEQLEYHLMRYVCRDTIGGKSFVFDTVIEAVEFIGKTMIYGKCLVFRKGLEDSDALYIFEVDSETQKEDFKDNYIDYKRGLQ